MTTLCDNLMYNLRCYIENKDPVAQYYLEKKSDFTEYYLISIFFIEQYDVIVMNCFTY
jgi:hypothetical protein